jgi:exodeoxyribonuclease V alpha subunit
MTRRGLPEWKQAEFNTRYFEVDADFLSGALTLRPIDNGLAVYLKSVFEDERLVEGTLTGLAARPEINLRRPVTEDDWASWIYKSNSDLALKARAIYAEATDEQTAVCQRLFRLQLLISFGWCLYANASYRCLCVVAYNFDLYATAYIDMRRFP